MTVDLSWCIIERALAKNAPDIVGSLSAGASEAEIERLERVVGQALPEGLRRWLQIHNGQSPWDSKFFNYNHLSSVDEIIRDFQMMQELCPEATSVDWLVAGAIRNVVWSPGWVKFTDDDDDGFVVDLCPGPTGVRGQVFYLTHDDMPTRVEAVSIDAFFERLASIVDQGKYEIRDGTLVLGELW